MGKFFLKKVDGVDDLVKVVNKPIWGKVPDFYRGTDWNIDDQWYTCNGTDILNSTDPFGDQSLIRKFMFNGDYVDKVTGTVTAVPGGTHNHFQTSGPFGTKCLTVEDAEAGVNQINCGTIPRVNLEGFTISGWVRVVDNSSLSPKRTNQDNVNNWVQIWHLQDDAVVGSRAPALFYSAIAGIFAASIIDTTTVFTNGSLGLPYTPNINSEWVYITQVLQKFTHKLYINGTLLGEFVSNSTDNDLNNGTFFLGHSYHGTNASYKSIELYKRDLTHTEVKALYNQQLFNEVLCDGSNPTYKPFTYLSEKEKLVRVVTDEAGNVVKYELVKKPGYIASTDNVVKYENGQLLDRYGKNVLSGSINRLLHFNSNTSVAVTASSIWATFLTADIELNTDKYDYMFMINTSVRILQAGNLTSVGGGSINLSIGNVPITTTAHRGYMSFSTGIAPGDSHETVQLVSPLINSGFKGKFKTRCSLARFVQDATVSTVSIYNDAFQFAPAPFNKTTGLNLSTLTVYELNKASNDLV